MFRLEPAAQFRLARGSFAQPAAQGGKALFIAPDHLGQGHDLIIGA